MGCRMREGMGLSVGWQDATFPLSSLPSNAVSSPSAVKISASCGIARNSCNLLRIPPESILLNLAAPRVFIIARCQEAVHQLWLSPRRSVRVPSSSLPSFLPYLQRASGVPSKTKNPLLTLEQHTRKSTLNTSSYADAFVPSRPFVRRSVIKPRVCEMPRISSARSERRSTATTSVSHNLCSSEEELRSWSMLQIQRRCWYPSQPPRPPNERLGFNSLASFRLLNL